MKKTFLKLLDEMPEEKLRMLLRFWTGSEKHSTQMSVCFSERTRVDFYATTCQRSLEINTAVLKTPDGLQVLDGYLSGFDNKIVN